MTEYKKALEEIVVLAGKLIMRYREGDQPVNEKEANEIVTPADVASSNLIIGKLSEQYSDIPIFTEEGREFKSQATTRWIVDPLDGTTSLVWGNSGFSISIALEENGQITVGCVYDPVMGELFYAEVGQGATKNGKPIHVASNLPMSEALLVVDWGNSDDKRKEGLSYFEKFLLPEMKARRVVPQFAPALGLCKIAEGRIHALVCNDTWVEDHSAGGLIVKEAGGCVTNFYNTSEFNHREFGIVASNNTELHSGITRLLKTR